MNVDLVKQCLKFDATALAGMFAGAAMYVNAADSPANMTLDTVNCRKHWMEAYNRAKLFQGGMCLAGSSAAAVVYYLDDESESRWLWLTGAGVFGLIIPFTFGVMMSDINKNCKDDVIETAGESWVRAHIQRWNRQHGVRTFLGCSAFGIFLYALSKK